MPSATTGLTPSLDKYIKSLKGQAPLEASIETLLSLLKRRQIKGSEDCAVATAQILLHVVAKSRWHDVETLLDNVCRVGRRLVDAQPNELVIANIVRRVLGLIRDEAAEDRNELTNETPGATPMESSFPNASNTSNQWPPSTYAKQDSGGDYLTSTARPIRPGPLPVPSSLGVNRTLFHILSASSPFDFDNTSTRSLFGNSGASTPGRQPGTAQVHALRSEVIDGIEEIKDEISQVDDQIAAVAEVQIHPGDYVLIHQPSSTVERFILRAAQRRRFTVLLATEVPRTPIVNAPYAVFKKRLQNAGIAVINIMNGGFMAYMSRVDKVILGARAIVANGGVVTDSGAAAIARAAKEHGNPVVVLSGVYKLCPINAFDEASSIEWGDSASHVSFSHGAMVNGVEIRSAVSELVPPELIDTYITNLGTHSQDHLSSLIADHYKQEDIDFHLLDESGQ